MSDCFKSSFVLFEVFFGFSSVNMIFINVTGVSFLLLLVLFFRVVGIGVRGLRIVWGRYKDG